MTKIVADSAKGRVLEVPTKGTRPTSECIHEALFPRLDHMGVLQDARVLDLCAGSGTLGPETTSRGASKMELVGKVPGATKVILENVHTTRLPAQCHMAPVTSFLAGHCGQALESDSDLVLIDPPYGVAEEELTRILRLPGPWPTRDAFVVIKRSTHSLEPKWPGLFTLKDECRWGETTTWFASSPLELEEAPAFDRKAGESDTGGDEADVSEAERAKEEHV